MKTFEEYLKKCELIPEQSHSVSGMSTGQFKSGMSMVCLETGFIVTVKHSRSAMRNKELCLVVYREYLEEIGLIEKKAVSLQTISNTGNVLEQNNYNFHEGDIIL